MIRRLLIAVTVFAVLAVALSGCSEPVPVKEESESTIKVGLILPMKGDFEAYGVLSKRGIELVVDEVNTRGGILGMPLETIDGDDASNPNVASHIANEYTQIRKAVAIIGPFTTQSALVAAPIANRDGVPLVAIRSSEANITAIGKYIFRACYVDNYQGTLLAKFAVQDLKAKTAAVIYNTGDQDVQALIDNFRQGIEDSGARVATVQAYDNTATDFSVQLKEVAKAKPDVLLLTDYEDKAGVIMKEARKMGITATFLGTDFWSAQNMTKTAGDAAENSYFTAHFSADDPDPKVREFVELYEGDYVAKPEVSAALGYDAMSLVVEAIEKAGSAKPEKIRAALAEIKDFKGVTGTFTFDENRNPVKGGVILKIQDGQASFVKRVEP